MSLSSIERHHVYLSLRGLFKRNWLNKSSLLCTIEASFSSIKTNSQTELVCFETNLKRNKKDSIHNKNQHIIQGENPLIEEAFHILLDTLDLIVVESKKVVPSLV